MKRRDFLRGLGLGMILSATVMAVNIAENKMTDDEIRSRALKLGMVEKEDALEQVMNKNTSKPEEKKNKKKESDDVKETDVTNTPDADDVTKEPTKAPTEEPTKEPTEEPTKAPTKEPEKTEQTKTTKEPKATKKPETEAITVSIVAGMWSEEIAKKFADLGLVDDAEAFDDYLCDNGYASMISVGEYKVPKGATYQEIAEIITK